MPNWCIGNLKIRGKVPDIMMFLNCGIYGYQFRLIDNQELSVTERKVEPYTIDLPEGFKFYVQQGNILKTRVFIDPENILDEVCECLDEQIIVYIKIECPWRFPTSNFRNLSEDYQIDFAFYGFERGDCFNQDVEIIKGVVTKDKYLTFNDYDWECISPTLGG